MISRSDYGKLSDGRQVESFSLKNAAGMHLRLITYGAIVTHLYAPDKHGNFGDVVLGYDSLEGYINDMFFIGAIVGRYANRIAKGRFRLDGHEFRLPLNDGNNHLHGGPNGFYKVLWTAESVESREETHVRLHYESPDGDQGYPGNLKLTVEYALSDANELIITYQGTTNKTTILNPTHHAYFNLKGDFATTILDHNIEIKANRFTPVGSDQIPTGEIAGVDGTPMDFSVPEPIGDRINSTYAQLIYGSGYDHNWVLNDYDQNVRKVASVYEQSSGRTLEVWTDQPGMQFYSGNFLNGSVRGKNGVVCQKRNAFCLEAQHFPDSPNQPEFPSVTLRPGETYHQKTIYKFSAR